MKTTTKYILSAILTLSSIVTFAMNPEFPFKKSEMKKEILSNLKFTQFVPVAADFEELLNIGTELAAFTALAPGSPELALFDDILISELNTIALSPETPEEATFEDSDPSAGSSMSVNSLAPATPKEAGFDDEASEPATLTSLGPVTPAEATFDEQ